MAVDIIGFVGNEAKTNSSGEINIYILERHIKGVNIS